jgi:hypothetical protein
MAHLLTSDSKSSDFAYDDAYRLFLITRREQQANYRFGRTQGQPVRFRASRTVRRVRGYLKNMIEAIADSKMRRVEREFELRGIRYDRQRLGVVQFWSSRLSQRLITCDRFHVRHWFSLPISAARSAWW